MSVSRTTFVHRVARLHLELEQSGVSLADMRRSPSLELQMAGVALPDRRAPERPAAIEPLEGAIQARLVPTHAPGASRIRYFLDGAQRTFLVWRVGLVPVAATVVAAAVLTRDATGRCTIVPGTLRLEHAWLIPRDAPDSKLKDLLHRIEGLGMTVLDPLQGIADEIDYAEMAGDYGKLIEASYVQAKHVRETLEQRLLLDWGTDPERGDDPGWIVVDGRLRVAVPRAIGLVKEISQAYLLGPDAEVLLGLPPRHRTTAFRPPDRFRGLGVVSAEDHRVRMDLTLWYLRLWDAAGLDARHALIRLEAGSEVTSGEQIDELSSWMMAERTPRATGDERWATLLYPVHYLERILKRSLESETRGWPGS